MSVQESHSSRHYDESPVQTRDFETSPIPPSYLINNIPKIRTYESELPTKTEMQLDFESAKLRIKELEAREAALLKDQKVLKEQHAYQLEKREESFIKELNNKDAIIVELQNKVNMLQKTDSTLDDELVRSLAMKLDEERKKCNEFRLANLELEQELKRCMERIAVLGEDLRRRPEESAYRSTLMELSNLEEAVLMLKAEGEKQIAETEQRVRQEVSEEMEEVRRQFFAYKKRKDQELSKCREQVTLLLSEIQSIQGKIEGDEQRRGA